MKKFILPSLLLISLTLILVSWGSGGHYKISHDASLSFNQQMSDFNTWTEFLADHARDADDRKNSDPNEAPRHYIDIDNYYSFLMQGRIPQTLDSVVTLYGHSFVYDNGILPYATIQTVALLEQCFRNHDMQNARIAAADLGHYVGDGHQPLHITANYDGGMTGNDGIHSRYESTMVNNHMDEISYTGDSISVIPDITAYVFNYIYHNNLYVDSIIDADDYAHNLAGNTNSYTYKQALWEKTGTFTVMLFRNASHALTELIYTAWVNAGSPSLTASDIEEFETAQGAYLSPVSPNPAVALSEIKYTLLEKNPVRIEVRNSSGELVNVLVNESQSAGKHTVQWQSSRMAAGVYYVILHAGQQTRCRKVIHTN